MAVEQLQKFTNNATTTVPGTTNNVTTTITVATGTGALFPTLAGSEFFIATLVNTVALDPGFGQMEIVKVTARSGDVMTVVRGQEGTSGTNFPAGILFELRPTAQAFNNIYTEVLELESTKATIASPTFTGDPKAPTPTTGDDDTSLATTAFVHNTLATSSYSRVMGQLGFNNSGSPDSQYDVSAEAVILKPVSTGGMVLRTSTGTVTNNTSTAGPTANGRDQAGAFSVNSWIHLYWIWNGTTLATVSSAVAPPTGPTMPATYTHWAYIGAIRMAGGGTLSRLYIRGSEVFWQTNQVTVSGGTAVTPTAVSVASFVPPNALKYCILGESAITTSGTIANWTVDVSVISASSIRILRAAMEGLASVAVQTIVPIYLPNVGQQYFYNHSVIAGSGPSAIINLTSFIIPNGDS